MNRVTKNFRKNNNRFVKDDALMKEYYLFSLSLRKEMLSDILEYEAFISDLLIQNCNFFSYSEKDLKRYSDLEKTIEYFRYKIGDDQKQKDLIKYLSTDDAWGLKPGSIEVFSKEIKKNNHSDLHADLERTKNGTNVKIRKVFEGISLGSKLHFIKKIDRNLLIRSFSIILKDKDTYYNHKKEELEPIKEFLFPFLDYLRDLRNILCHRNINLDQNDLFLNAYKNISKRKHKINFFNKVLRDQLMIIHGKTFYERMEEKTLSNPKISNEIFYEIMSQPMWKSI